MIKINHQRKNLEVRGAEESSFFILILIPLLAFGVSTHFQDNYTVVKWLILYIFTGLFSFSLILKKSFPLPKVGLFHAIVFLFFSILGITSLFSHNSSFFFQKLLDYLTFIVLVYLLLSRLIKDNKFIEKLNWVNLFTCVLCTGVGYDQLFGNRPLITYAQNISSFFGNPNMAAQFISIGLISNIFLLNLKNKKKYYLLVSLTFLTTYLIVLNCRSTLLAIFICLLFLLKDKMLKKCIFVSLFLALVFAKTLPFKYVSSSKDTASIVTSLASNMPLRNGSIKERLEMWKGTLFLMKDNFFIGIGPGEFEFDFIPFQKRYTESQMTENVIFNTPHNDFLRIAAEYGVPFLVICMSIFLSMFKKNTKKDIDKNDYYIKILTLFFAVEGFFQFPLLNTYSFFYIILIISYYIYKSYETIQFNSIQFNSI
jgi:O-antigen ligase